MIIYKYELHAHGITTLEIDAEARILSADVQAGNFIEDAMKYVVWILVNPNAPKILRRILVANTGQEIETTKTLRFVATVQYIGIVKHVFEIIE